MWRLHSISPLRATAGMYICSTWRFFLPIASVSSSFSDLLYEPWSINSSRFIGMPADCTVCRAKWRNARLRCPPPTVIFGIGGRLYRVYKCWAPCDCPRVAVDIKDRDFNTLQSLRLLPLSFLRSYTFLIQSRYLLHSLSTIDHRQSLTLCLSLKRFSPFRLH